MYTSHHPWVGGSLFQEQRATDQVPKKTCTSEESVTAEPWPRSSMREIISTDGNKSYLTDFWSTVKLKSGSGMTEVAA